MEAAKGWLQGWTGLADRRYRGRGQARRVRLRLAEGRRGPVGSWGAGTALAYGLEVAAGPRGVAAAPAAEGAAGPSGAARLQERLRACLPCIGGVWAVRRDQLRGAGPLLLP